MVEYDNSLVGEEEAWAFGHVWAAITDWQVGQPYAGNKKVTTHCLAR